MNTTYSTINEAIYREIIVPLWEYVDEFDIDAIADDLIIHGGKTCQPWVLYWPWQRFLGCGWKTRSLASILEVPYGRHTSLPPPDQSLKFLWSRYIAIKKAAAKTMWKIKNESGKVMKSYFLKNGWV